MTQNLGISDHQPANKHFWLWLFNIITRYFILKFNLIRTELYLQCLSKAEDFTSILKTKSIMSLITVYQYSIKYLYWYAKWLANSSFLLGVICYPWSKFIQTHYCILGLHIPPDLKILCSWYLLSLDLDACHHILIERSQHTCHWYEKPACPSLHNNIQY